MSLSAGTYRIISRTGKPVGRYFVEDLSLLPKRVMALPKDGGEPPIWQIDQVNDGVYKLRANDAYVGRLPDGHVFAFLLEDMLQGAEWRITHVPQSGENAYIIETADREGGWVVDSDAEEASQIAVRPVISTRSLPPQYPPNYVFDIIRA